MHTSPDGSSVSRGHVNFLSGSFFSAICVALTHACEESAWYRGEDGEWYQNDAAGNFDEDSAGGWFQIDDWDEDEDYDEDYELDEYGSDALIDIPVKRVLEHGINRQKNVGIHTLEIYYPQFYFKQVQVRCARDPLET
eukprot:6102238-Amphidinium_carterae.1